jgi:hypothetical protein
MARQLAGKKGRAALTELRDALLAMPQKRLIYHDIVKDDDVCAVGALIALKVERETQKPREQVLHDLEGEYSSCNPCGDMRKDHADDGAGPCRRCAEALRKHLESELGARYPEWYKECPSFNADGEPEDGLRMDDGAYYTDDVATGYGIPRLVAWRLVELNDMQLDRETPEERYEKVLKWVENRLAWDDKTLLRAEAYY